MWKKNKMFCGVRKLPPNLHFWVNLPFKVRNSYCIYTRSIDRNISSTYTTLYFLHLMYSSMCAMSEQHTPLQEVDWTGIVRYTGMCDCYKKKWKCSSPRDKRLNKREKMKDELRKEKKDALFQAIKEASIHYLCLSIATSIKQHIINRNLVSCS